MTPVPFTDLGAMAGEVWPEIEQDYLACLLDGAYVGGRAVTAFEREWAAYCGVDHAVGVASGTDGIAATRQLGQFDGGGPAVIVVTTFENDDYVYDALQAGTRGFLLKRSSAEDYVNAIRTVHEGESLLFPAAVRRLATRHGGPLLPRAPVHPVAVLPAGRRRPAASRRSLS